MYESNKVWNEGEKMKYTKETFPRCTISRDEMIELNGHVDHTSCMTFCDVLYSETDGYKKHLHIMVPTQDKNEIQRFPLIVYVQGSAWKKQTLGREIIQLGRLCAKGYVIAIVEYRPSDVAKFPAQIIDTKYAIDFLMKHSEEYFIKKNKFVLWGSSSGAHTALMTNLTKDLDFFTPEDVNEYNPKCLIDYYGPTDIYEMRFQPSLGEHCTADCPEALLLGKIVTKENSRDTVVMNYIDKSKNIPPIFIMHGDMDDSVPFEQSVMLYDQLKKSNKDVVFYKVKDAGHGGSEFWNDEILEIIHSYIQLYLN